MFRLGLIFKIDPVYANISKSKIVLVQAILYNEYLLHCV
jgi:hypothetical protein